MGRSALLAYEQVQQLLRVALALFEQPCASVAAGKARVVVSQMWRPNQKQLADYLNVSKGRVEAQHAATPGNVRHRRFRARNCRPSWCRGTAARATDRTGYACAGPSLWPPMLPRCMAANSLLPRRPPLPRSGAACWQVSGPRTHPRLPLSHPAPCRPASRWSASSGRRSRACWPSRIGGRCCPSPLPHQGSLARPPPLRPCCQLPCERRPRLLGRPPSVPVPRGLRLGRRAAHSGPWLQLAGCSDCLPHTGFHCEACTA